MHLLRKSQLFFIVSFAALILAGTVMLEGALWIEGKHIPWIDALFVSTSAVCVTGLTTVNISMFGFLTQGVLLLLIELGALGVITLTSVIILLVRHEMNIDNKILVSGIIESYSRREINKLLYVICLYTIAIEVFGAILLAVGFWVEMKEPFGYSVYLGLFHSISAFCNAGFSPYDDSLMRAGPIIKLGVSALIIFGGLGFYVIYDICQMIAHGTFMKMHTKIVLITSAILVIAGMVGLKFFEFGEGGYVSWMDALFQSVSARTAGFNSIDLTKLHPSSIMLMIVLMLIGTAPGSTGGGIKITVFAVVMVAIWKTFIGEREIVMFKRRIAMPNVLKSFAITFVYIGVALIGMIALSIFEDFPGDAMLFESASALGTVGLSLGVSAKAGIGGKLVLIFLMYLGRVGPLTFFIFLLSRERSSRIRYPEERIIMG